jgi:hypothetical protein
MDRHPGRGKVVFAGTGAPPVPAAAVEKNWWEVELEMLAATRSTDDLEDAPRKHLLLRRLFNEDVLTTRGRKAEWWSAIDSNIVVDLDGPGTATAAAVKVDASSSDFEFGLDDDDGNSVGNALDFSAFHHC